MQAQATSDHVTPWPVIATYTGEYLSRVAMPIGGIGSGTVSLGGRGDLRDWEVANRPAKGFHPRYSFFCLWTRTPSRPAVVRALEGQLGHGAYAGTWGSTEPNHSLPRFRACRFEAAYPFAQVHLNDEDVPLRVTLEAFNPLIPCEADDSGLPVAILRYVLSNPGTEAVEASLCGSLQNFIGDDGTAKLASRNRNTFRAGSHTRGIDFTSDGVSATAESFGTLALVTTAPDSAITHRTSWLRNTWSADLSDFWDDLTDDGKLEERHVEGEQDRPQASLAVSLSVPPGESRTVTFLLAWHFPNRESWNPPGGWKKAEGPPETNRIGNHYATRFKDAFAVAEYAAEHLPRLEKRTRQFVEAIAGSSLPREVQEAALNNLAALRSQTAFRGESGVLSGWEGCNVKAGCCPGSCTHVWNYEFVTPYLYGELAWSMRRAEFGFATDDAGNMRFRIELPLAKHAGGAAAADGQMGAIVKFYRQWRLSGDDATLRELWPAVRRAMEFAWRPGGWDADCDGVIEGLHHNTMDVDYFGPTPQVTSIYLAALLACVEMAQAMGDEPFAGKCRDLAQRGREQVDRTLFNGEYYQQEIRYPEGRETGGWPEDAWQIGAGCEATQVIGDLWGATAGLGHVLDRAKVEQSLLSLVRHNFREAFYGHFNPVRSFALNDEPGLVLCSFPRGEKPKFPTPYYAEIWTGIEYSVAAHLKWMGHDTEALRLVAAVRNRHDGRKRNPFDEPECGHHYARAMSSWALVPAWSGFDFDARSGAIRFADTDSAAKWFWSTGHAWGRAELTRDGEHVQLILLCLGGTLSFSRVTIGDRSVNLPQPFILTRGVAWGGSV